LSAIPAGEAISRKIRLDLRTKRKRQKERASTARESCKRRPPWQRPYRLNRRHLLSNESTALAMVPNPRRLLLAAFSPSAAFDRP